jgi:hypothetical protein
MFFKTNHKVAPEKPLHLSLPGKKNFTHGNVRPYVLSGSCSELEQRALKKLPEKRFLWRIFCMIFRKITASFRKRGTAGEKS